MEGGTSEAGGWPPPLRPTTSELGLPSGRVGRARLLWVWCDEAKERAPARQMFNADTVRFIYGVTDGRTTSVAPSRGTSL